MGGYYSSLKEQLNFRQSLGRLYKRITSFEGLGVCLDFLITVSSGDSQYIDFSNLPKGEVLILVPKQLLQVLLL